MIGSGHYVMIELWNEGEIAHAGLLEPGQNFAGNFTDGLLLVSGFVLTRLTRDQVEALEPGQVFGPVRVPSEIGA